MKLIDEEWEARVSELWQRAAAMQPEALVHSIAGNAAELVTKTWD